MKMNKLGFLGFCLILFVTIPDKLNIAVPYNSSRRIRENDSEYQLNRIISMLSQLEKGTFPLNSFKPEDAIHAVLDFLKQPDTTWKMKERLLQWMPDFFTLLSPRQQRIIRKEFKNLDKEEYQKQLMQALDSLDYPITVLRFPLSFLYGAEPLVTNIEIHSAVEMAILRKIDRHPFSKYLP